VQNQQDYTWTNSTTDTRALQTADGSTRIAAVWYNTPRFNFDVNFADGNSHQFALYTLDWDSSGRAETIQIVDATTQTVLDTESISNFTNGIYLVWNITGHVQINIIETAGNDAVVNGVFFGGSSVVNSVASFLRTDTTTQGNWHGAYGADGYSIANDSQSVPSYASFAVQNQQNYTWSDPPTDVRALETGNGSDRIASVWYNLPEFNFDLNLTDGNSHQLALYAVDWDNSGRAETIQILDAATDALLDTRSISNFTNGLFLVWNVKGHVKLNIIQTAGNNAVVSGVFFGANSTISSSAAFLRTDTTTQGNWHGTYGSDGYSVANDSQAVPAYASFAVQNQQDYTWSNSPTDARSLQTGSASGRIAAVWYNTPEFNFDVNFTDGNSHQFALYAVDWDNSGRAETIQILDAATDALLDTRSISNFTNGLYLAWNVSGHIRINVILTAGNNSVVSGVFFGGGSAINSVASFVRTDTTTQGSWHGTYGSDGYSIANDSQSLPSYANFAVQNQANWTWLPLTTDPRALQTGSNSGSIAATWYNTPEFNLDVNLTDGQSHQLALYAMDWDSSGRAETIELLDAATGALLDTRNISSFVNGLYLVWNVSGHVKINIIQTAGNNAVVSGIFFGTPVPPPSITSLSPTSAVINTPVTITGTNFGPSQGTSTLTFNGVAGTPTSWNATSIVAPVPSGATTGNVVVTVSGVASNGVAFTVSSSSPAPVISGISPSTGGIGSAVTIAGSNFGGTQGQSSVSFNGIVAIIAGWSDTGIAAKVPGGLNPGTATVNVSVNQLVSNGVQFTVTQPLFLTPSQSTMLVGQTRTMQLLDENGALINNPAWTFDNGSIAEILPPVNPGDPTLLQADAPGITTVTAAYGGRTGNAKITVLLADATLPIGSVQWEVPSLGSGRIAKTVQSVRVDDNTPDLYAEDDGAFGGNGAIRALNADGSQKWIWRPAGTDNSPFIAAADDLGGVVYFATMDSPNQFDSYCYFGRLDENGNETWQYQETNCREDYAIHPDGTIFLIEPAFQNTNADFITALDPNTGQIKFTIPAPGDVSTRGAMSISSDGSVYLPFSTSVDVQLMVIQSDGSSSTQQLDSSPAEGLGRAIPDGQGGALVTASFPPALYHASTSGSSKFSLPITPPQVIDGFEDDGSILPGEDGTLYIAGASNSEGPVDTQLAIDPSSGTVKWSVVPGGTPYPSTLTADGSLVFQYFQGGSQHLAFANSTGQISPLFANPVDGSDAAPANASSPNYWTLGTWFVSLNSGAGLAAINGPTSGPGSDTACCAWTTAGGEPQRQRVGDPTATITVNFTGHKSQGDQLNFSGAGTCSQDLGLWTCPLDSWAFYIEGVATVSDDASKWRIRQNAVITRVGNTKDAQGVLNPFRDSFNSNVVPGDDDPCVLNDSRPGCVVSVQQPSGQNTIYWLDHPGTLYHASANVVFDSLTENGLFTSKACNRFGICTQVKWFIKLQVDPGSILNCAQSLDGFLGQPITCP
jgi:uncharacterized protein (TIGR03437 family)